MREEHDGAALELGAYLVILLGGMVTLMTMKSINRVGVVATSLGAALGLKENESCTPNSSSYMKQHWVAADSGSSSGHLTLAPSKQQKYDEKLKAAEDSMRMVVYLSCWGLN